jgi:hypothetical protein
MHKRVAIAVAAALAACGGSSWTDPTTGTFTAQDSAEIMGLLSGSFGAVAQSGINSQMAAQNPKALTESVSFSSTCSPSGTVSVTGSMDASCNSAGTSCSFNGGLHLTLNACANPNGLVGDGQLNIGASGSSSSSSVSVHETIQGGITVHRNGTLVGTCGINVTVDVSGTGLDTASPQETVHVSGTVCRQPVAQ